MQQEHKNKDARRQKKPKTKKVFCVSQNKDKRIQVTPSLFVVYPPMGSLEKIADACNYIAVTLFVFVCYTSGYLCYELYSSRTRRGIAFTKELL